MATISDVVKRSGISKATVSRVINNHPNVSKEKREKVLAAMKELSYTPNPTARRMRGQLNTTVGLVVHGVVNPFFSYLMDAVERKAAEHNIRVIFFQSKESKEKEMEFLDLLKQKQIDGIILAAVESSVDDIRPYLEYGPIVFCNEYLRMKDVPIVRISEEDAAFTGITHLLEEGYKNIAYCTGGLFADEGKDRDRNTGFRKAMEAKNLAINPEWVFVDQHTMEDGRIVMKKITEMNNKPDAIFTGSDEVAAGMTIAAREHGVKIPEDLAVLGFDDQPLCLLTSPQLSTIHQPIEEMGALAAELIIKLFKGEKLGQEEYELPVQLIKRSST
ncbi:LacI family DNA-binding transcriptional regulator [Alkalicoccus halolimnae]|uniref:LacI family DNA-binding transcriptional regulator n=1 Tax=Alkalicoccus halolimnae TaxID=1667239 RepID=A0A5C7F4R2_9BACI|nr:LacI family DNA-binding transcriptional regulator [Alkalicoccus halolimnae]TXF83610.1 LacI family transcriptional regulator [Alkalicoccus halolimnae]